MAQKPNLFNYATSELSQDAMICWLMSWASPNYKDVDPDLHYCSVGLIEAMFQKHSKSTPPKLNEIEIYKQDKHIDVLCVINKKYAIIIEDKIHTQNSLGQLERYLKEIKDRNFCDQDIIPIYFKTGDQADYSEVLKNGYHPFLRYDILRVLNQYEGKNPILIDYREYLQFITDSVESYKTLPIGNWDRNSWIGFYLRMQKELTEGHWDYVPNANGGFWGFWWHFLDDGNCEQYLQLEESKLCFKVSVEELSKRSDLRDQWHNVIIEKNKEPDYALNIERPLRFGCGWYMTVCIYHGDYRQCDSNGVIDIDKTVQVLKSAERLLEAVSGI